MIYIIFTLCFMFFSVSAAELTGKDLVLFRATLQRNTLKINTDIENPALPPTPPPSPELPADQNVRAACNRTKVAIIVGATSVVTTGLSVAGIILAQYAQQPK